MNATQLRKVIIYASVLAVILIGFYFGLWRPRIGHIKKVQKNINVQQNVMAQLKRDIQTFPETITLKKLQNVEENLEQVLARIPSEEEVHTILKQIQTYGTQNADLHIMKITDLTQEMKKGNLGAIQASSSISKVIYQITAEGSAQDIIQFMYEIENGVRMITIEDFVLRRLTREDEEDFYSVNADITLNIFYANIGNLPGMRSPGPSNAQLIKK